MLSASRDFDRLRAEFRWDIPARYNIGVDVCDRWAKAEPDRPAIIDVTPGGASSVMTFEAMRAASNRLANLLRRRGIAPGERIGILLPQSSEVAVSHVAAYKLGAIALPL